MAEKIYRFFIISILVIVFVTNMDIVHLEASTESIEDGTYNIDYMILRAENDSVSIANDYFEKPATLIVENGEKYIQFSINHSQWVKELQSPFNDDFIDVTVIEESAADDMRLVQFKVDGGLTEPIEFKMHVYIDSMEPIYDHRYTVRFDFDLDSLEKIEAKDIFRPVKEVEKDALANNDEIPLNENGKASQPISITFASILIIATILFIFVIWKTVKKNKKID